MSPLRGNSSRGMCCVFPGNGGSRTSSPEGPLGSSGSIGGFVCMEVAPKKFLVDRKVPQPQCQAGYALPPLWESADGVLAIAVFR
jgi:hypothetical protein